MKYLKGFVLITLGFVLIEAGILLHCSWQAANVLKEETRGLKAAAREQIATEMKEIRALVSLELDKTRADARAEIRALSDRADSKLDRIIDEADAIAKIADARAASIQSDLNERLELVQQDLLARADLTLQPINKSLGVIQETLYDTLVCYDEETGYHNADCFYNRYVGAARGVEDIATNFADLTKLAKDTTPAIVEDAHKFTGHSANISGNFDKAVDSWVNPPWYKKIYSIGLAVVSAGLSLVK